MEFVKLPFALKLPEECSDTVAGGSGASKIQLPATLCSNDIKPEIYMYDIFPVHLPPMIAKNCEYIEDTVYRLSGYCRRKAALSCELNFQPSLRTDEANSRGRLHKEITV